MSALDELKNRLNTERSSTGNGSPLDELKKRLEQDRTEEEVEKVDSTYINTFAGNVNRYFSTAETDFNNVGWGNAASSYQSRYNDWNSLNNEANAIKSWMSKNQGQIDKETYDYLTGLLNNFDTNSSSILDAFSGQRDYFAQWETQKDYDDYVASQKAYEESVNLDLNAAQKEIDDLTAKRDEIIRSRNQTDRPYLARDNASIGSPYGAVNQNGDETDKELYDLAAAISQKETYLNQAKYLQEGIKLGAVSQNSDFAKFSVRDDQNSDIVYSYINGADNGVREEMSKSQPQNNYLTGNAPVSTSPYAAGIQADSMQYPVESLKVYDYMHNDEIAIYNYHYAKDGKETAERYLHSITEELNKRRATDMFKGLEDKTIQELLFGISAGLNQFASGVDNLFNTEDDYIPMSAYQIASGMVREDLADAGPNLPDWMGGASLGQVGYDAITTTANMAPSVLTSMAVSMVNPVAGEIVGTSLMGASAAGNAYQEALNLGYSKGQARAYSALVGGSEAGLQYLLGGIGKLGGKLTGNAVTKLVSGIDKAFARAAIKLGGSMLSEGMEEGLQEVLTPWFKNLVFRTDESVNWSEVAYSTLLGALTAGFMEGGGVVSGEVNTYKTGRKLQAADVSAQRLAEIGKTMSADTVAYQLAGRVNENTGAYTMGRLFNEIGAEITEMNKADIQRSLEQNGFPKDVAAKNAEAFARVVAGEKLTDGQISVIEANSELAKIVREVIIDPNSTVNQRTQGYKEVLKALAQEKAGVNASRSNPAKAGQENTAVPDMADTQGENAAASPSEADTAQAKVRSIASIADGKMTVRLEDGTEVNATDADLDPEEAVIIKTIADIKGISAADANFILGSLKAAPGVNPQWSALGASEAYRYGFYGMSEDHMMKHGAFASSLTETQRRAIYETGRNARQTQVEAKQEAVSKKETPTQKATGKVHFNGDRSTITERQRASLTAMEKIADVLGVQIYVFESKVNERGKRVGDNGWYDPRDSSIHIDLHAGSSGEGAMLFTLAHELTHHIRKWSPAKFKILADFLMEEYGKKGVNVDALVREQMAKAKRGGRTISYDTAYEEVVADSMETMLSDGKVMEKLAKLKQKDASLWQKIKDFISELAAKIRSVYEGLAPDSVEGRYVAEMKDSIEKLQELFAEALVDASENYQSSLTPGEEGVITNQNGDPVAYSTEDGSVLLSMRTYEEDGREAFRKYLQKCVSSKKLTKADMQEMLNGIEEIYGICKEFKDKYAPFSSWSDAAVVRDTHGRPVFSVVTPNGDYKMNLDFSLVCKKRRTLDAVFNEMSRRGIIDDFELGQKSVVKINEIIRKYGLETACALCFVDAKRFRQASMADQFTSLYNELVESLVPEDQKGSIDHFNFSGYATIKKVDGGIDTWDNSKLDFSHINHVLKTYGDGTVEYKAAKYIKTHAEGRKLLLRGDFMSSQGFDAVKTQNRDILKLYNSKKGTGGPKAAFGDVQYMNEVIQKARWWTPKKAYEVGGIRIQSFSDYVPRMVFDYVQMIYDLAATKLPAHAYTKEALFVKQFGLTGVKINMSLIPAIVEGGIAPGLDANGNYVWAGESFDFETAKEIQNAPGYTENCGTICVGVSYKHIVKLLGDPNIRMVIPYHKSGLNPIVAHMNKVAEFTDYTTLKTNPGGCQNTIDKNGNKVEKDFNFNDVLRKTGDPKETVRQYLSWCAQNEYTPRFAEFAWHENYYKLLEDFTLYDKDGNYVPQREVRAVFPKADSAFGSMKDLIREGLEEDAVVEGKRDKSLSKIVDEIQRTLPKSEAEIAETQVEQADRDLEAEVKYSIREAFYKEYDAWNKKDTHGKVKVQSPKNMSEMQKKLFEAGVIDEFGNKRLSDRDTKSASNQSGHGSTADEIKFSMRSPVEETRDLIAVHNLREDNLLAALEMGGMPMPSIAVTKKDGAYTDYGAISVVFRKSTIDPQADARNRVYGADAWTPTISQVDRGLLPENPSAQDFVEAMKQIGDRGVRMGDKSAFNLIAVAPAEYGSIAEIKADSERLGDVDEEVLMQQVMEPIMTAEGILEALSDGNLKLREKAYSALMEAAKKGGSKDTIRKVFKDHGFALTHQQTNDIQKAYHEVAKVRTTYFEAKPERVISPDEWALVVVPKDVNPKLRKKLEGLGVNIAEYERGNNESRIKAVNSNPELLFSDRDTESVSNRSLLANALEGAAQNEIEQKKLQEYKSKIERINAEEQKLRELNRQIKDLSFAKGPRDTKKINALRIEAQQTANRIDICDTQLLRLEASKPLQNVLEREKKKAYQRAEQKGKKALDDYRLKAEAKQSEILRDYREARAAIRQAESETAVMEKEFIRIVKAYDKLQERSAAKSGKDSGTIAELKTTLKEEAKSHRQDQKMWESEFNRLLREYEAADRNIGKLEEKIERQKKAAAEKVEMRKRSVMREKIKAFKARLERSLLNPTDRQYVPMGLINAMVEVCDLIDTDTDLYKSDGSINKAQEQRNLTKEKLQNLKDEYEKLRNHADPIYKGEFDEMIYAYLTELRDSFAGKNLKEMNLDELREMYEILRSIEETLQDARKLIGWGEAETVYEAGDAIVAEQNRITKSRKGGKRNAIQIARDNSLNLSLSPVRNVERMCGYNQESSLLKLFKKFEQGIRKKNRFVMEAYKSFESLTSGKEYEDAIYREVGGKKYTDIKGRKFGISKMQMMQAILSYEREAANGMHHIENDGFTFADLDMLRKGKLKDAVSAEYSHRVPAAVELAAEFAEVLKNDRWCQDYMNAARKFFNGTAKDAINETGIALKHRIIAKDKNYIPFEVDKNFIIREISAANDVQQTISSYGMLKDTKDGAPQPLIITGLNNVLDRHIDMVGNVYGLAVEVRNYNKVWDLRSGNNQTVKEAIETNWGKEGVAHIEQAVQDIQGKRIRERSTLYDKVKSGYIGATFLLNLSVVTKQIGSLFSATSMLKWRGPVRQIGNLLYTMANHKKISAEVDRYTATAWMRRQGLSDAELHTFMTEGKKTLVGRAVDKLPAVFNPGKWITAMDHAVALSLWKYAKADTAKRTGLNGDELLKATAEFYDEVIENTQSMTDVLHRPEIQKRSDIISESFAMFKTDLYQMAGQLQVAAGRYTANKTKENGKALGRTVYAIAMSAVWAQLMTTVFALLRYKVNHYRDDEDKDLTYESWLKKQSFALAGDLMGYLFPIFGSEAVGVFENIMYGESEDIVDSIALTTINDLLDTMVTAASALKDGEMPKPDQMKKLTIKALQVFGIPANNIIRTYEAIHLHAKDIANGEFLSFEAGVDRSPKQHMHRIVEAMEEGRTDVAKGLFEEAIEETAIDKTGGSSYSEDDLKSARDSLRTALGNKFKEGAVSEKQAVEILVSLFDYKRDDAKSLVGEWAFKVEYGVAWSDRSDAYLDGTISARELKTALMNVGGKTAEEADEYIVELNFEKKFGFPYKDLKEQFMNGSISASEAKTNIIVVEGKSGEDAGERIAKWQFEADYPELIDRVTYAQYKRWETDGQPYGVSIELFADVAEFRDDGTSSSVKSQDEVKQYIMSAADDNQTRHALWCCFYKASTSPFD